MVNNERWERLDLRQRSVFGPYDDQLVAIRIIPKVRPRTERYEVGRFTTLEGKTWFLGNYNSTEDVARIRKKYEILWTPLPKPLPADAVLRGI